MWTAPGEDFDQESTANFFLPYDEAEQTTGSNGVIFGPMQPTTLQNTQQSNIFYRLIGDGSFEWPDPHSGAIGEPFDIMPGVGYMYYNSAISTKTLPFTHIDEFDVAPNVTIADGYSGVGFPASTGVSAYDLIQGGDCAIPGVSQMLTFDSSLQQWRVAFYYPQFDMQLGPDFALDNEEGYIVFSDAAGSYNPNGCAPTTALLAAGDNTNTSQVRDNLAMAQAMSEVYASDVSSASATVTWFTDGIGTTILPMVRHLK
jgi:hypothetical protein